MKIYFLILILFFNLQSLTKAGDIKGFELEGMSIGDSAIKYFSKTELDNLNYGFVSKEFAYVTISENKLEIYDDGLIIIKPSDKSFKIHSISGRIFFKNDVNSCYKQQDLIADEFSNAFDQATRSKKDKYMYAADKSGKSNVQTINFEFKNGSGAHIGCYNINIDFLKANNMYPSPVTLSVSLNSSEYVNFQKNLLASSFNTN